MQEHQIGAAVSQVIGNLERPVREGNELESLRACALEQLANPVIKFGSHRRSVSADIALDAPNDLRDVGLTQELELRPGSIVQVRRVRHEPLAGVVDEADVRTRRDHGETKAIRMQATKI